MDYPLSNLKLLMIWTNNRPTYCVYNVDISLYYIDTDVYCIDSDSYYTYIDIDASIL